LNLALLSLDQLSYFYVIHILFVFFVQMLFFDPDRYLRFLQFLIIVLPKIENHVLESSSLTFKFLILLNQIFLLFLQIFLFAIFDLNNFLKSAERLDHL